MSLHQVVVSSKGQITLPKTLRDDLKLEEGSNLQLIVLDNGSIRMIPKVNSIMDAAGMLTSSTNMSASLEEMEEGIITGATRGAFPEETGAA